MRFHLFVPAFLSICASLAAATMSSADRLVLDSALVMLVSQHYDDTERILNDLALRVPGNPEIVYQRLAARQTRILDYESYPIHGPAFLLYADSTIAELERRLATLRGQDSIECLFYLGNAVGGKGVIYAKLGNWLAAVRYAARSKDLLGQVLRLDRGYYAANLGVGVYNYYLGRGLKWVPFITGRTEKGIAEIEQATRAVFPYDIAAKSTLCWILIERDQYARADSICAQVLERLPGNSIFIRIRACIALWTGQYERAVPTGQNLIAISAAREPPNWNDMMTGYRTVADSYFALGRHDDCRTVVAEALSLPVPPSYRNFQYIREHTERLRELERLSRGTGSKPK